MRSDHYRQVQETLLAACRLPAEERASFLDRECGSNTALRQEVESLLRFEENIPRVIRTGIAAVRDAALTGEINTDHLPQRVGTYDTLELLGAGGMGIVYRAMQVEPIRREVALKLIRHGMRTEHVIARFEMERQALARLDHRNIAKVLDAGADESGHPFFVMELVSGRPITQYCHHGSLSPRERLALFLSVCRAVEHAHQRGILHRDLKPSNILVAEEDGIPVPKVIDFGVARAIEQVGESETPALTEMGQLIGTPQYMSPEQAAGSASSLDTRSDVYSLGVLLYEVLTGRLPYETSGASSAEAARMVAECEPTPLRQAWTFRERLDPDLQTIITKALMKETAERYSSSSALAGDIERFLANEPILARPPSATYQLRKLIRRHRAPFAFLVILLATIVGFGVTMSFLYQSQIHERERAEREAEKATRLNDFLLTMLGSVDPESAQGEEVTVQELLESGIEPARQELADQPEILASVLRTIGSSYGRLDKLEEAEELLRESVRLRQKVFGPDHLEVAEANRDLAQVLIFRGELAEAESLSRAVLKIRSGELDEGHTLIAGVWNDIGYILRLQGRYEESATAMNAAVEMRRASGDTTRALAEMYGNLGAVQLKLDRLEDAEKNLRLSYDTFRKFEGGDHPSTAMAAANLATVLREEQRLDEAETLHREAIAIGERVLGEHQQVAAMYSNLGLVLRDKGETAAAEVMYQKSLALVRNLFGDEHYGVAVNLHNLGGLAETSGNLEEAEEYFRESIRIRRNVLRPGHPSIAPSLSALGNVLVDAGRPLEGVELLRESLTIYGEALPEGDRRISETRQWYEAALEASGQEEGAD